MLSACGISYEEAAPASRYLQLTTFPFPSLPLNFYCALNAPSGQRTRKTGSFSKTKSGAALTDITRPAGPSSLRAKAEAAGGLPARPPWPAPSPNGVPTPHRQATLKAGPIRCARTKPSQGWSRLVKGCPPQSAALHPSSFLPCSVKPGQVNSLFFQPSAFSLQPFPSFPLPAQ